MYLQELKTALILIEASLSRSTLFSKQEVSWFSTVRDNLALYASNFANSDNPDEECYIGPRREKTCLQGL